jgi:uncharacterized membrane protein (DUF4010 family)
MIMDVTTQNLYLMGSSLAIGLLIGMERGWHSRGIKEGQRIAGIRTFALIGLLGGITGFIANQVGGIVLGLIFFGFTLFITAAYALNSRHTEDVSITGLIAVLLTFILGTLATMGFIAEAASVSIVTAMILRFKIEIHSILHKLEKHELHATLELLLISVVLLTILPDKSYGPWDAFNPFEIWWLVVLVASISFLGYFAMKIAGPKKGTILTALFAGFVSSTALTLHFSRLAKERPDMSNLLSLGILLACGVMFFRLLMLMLILNADLFMKLLWPTVFMGSLIIALALMGWRRNGKDFNTNEQKLIKNPLALKSALLFGVLLTIVGIAIRGVHESAGDMGVYTFSALTGLVDVDSIALSLTRMVTAESQIRSFSIAIIIATWANTLLKATLAYFIGGRSQLRAVSVPLVGTVLASMLMVYCLL